ncbi:MAG: class I SAM-dependent methyltransferase [Cyanobacteria bacterium J06638_22]
MDAMTVREPDLSQQTLGQRDLCDRIAQRIVAAPNGQIPFADFMALALYDPEYGYYATNRVNIGGAGDFYTAPHLGGDFGELLAEQFAEMWRLLDYPNPFTLVEMGAGQGLLVRDILRYLHRHHDACFDAVNYVIVEGSPALRQEQQQRMAKLAQSFGRLHWHTWEEIVPDSIVGCFFSNELIDALPVHRVVWKDGSLYELHVMLADAAASPDGAQQSSAEPPMFVEAIAPLSTPALQQYFEQSDIDFVGANYPDGYTTEVNLAALEWMETVSQRLQRGYVLTIDYGYPAQRYYLPTRRSGTLQCYFQHRHHDDPFINIGLQDITAHVNFTALERQGEACGLQPLGYTQQGLFLMALGLGDRIAAVSTLTSDESLTINDILGRREALHTLIDPSGMGNFGVLLQGKGDCLAQSLQGFCMP